MDLGPGSSAPAAAPPWARPYESPAGRAKFVLISFVVLLVAYVLVTLGDLLSIQMHSGGAEVTRDQPLQLDLVQGLSGLALLVALPLTVIAFCMWIHRIYRNLPAIGATGLQYSPRWAAGSWFVPILNIWRPYKIVREIWQHTGPPNEGWDLIKVWWALWLVSNYVDNAVLRLGGNGSPRDALDALSNVIDAAAAVLAMLLVRKLTAWQEQKHAAASATGIAPSFA